MRELPPPESKDIAKGVWRERVRNTRESLLDLQRQQRLANFSVMLVFAGVDGGGKHECINLLSSWLDPRNLLNLAYHPPTEAEAGRPRLWRYWRDLPAHGQMASVLSGWYSQPLLNHVKGHIDDAQFRHQIDEISSFERMLADDGTLILKFWFHLSAQQQRARLKSLLDDPLSAWQARPSDWEHLHLYQRFVDSAAQMIESSHSDQAPWHTLDGGAQRLRSLQVAETLEHALRERLKAPASARKSGYRATRKRQLAQVDLDRQLDKQAYQHRLQKAQSRLATLARLRMQSRRSSLIVFEGWDAAGKGGAIRRLVRPLDARYYRVVPIAAPNDEERSRHYLWRFWRHLPAPGHWSILDRSWYGRVLVERVEGFAQAAEWQRAYTEIRAFEEELTDAGIHLIKFWLHISEQEQLQRFQAREADPLKNWKLTDEDWRNRDKRPQYEAAVEDMLAKTDCPAAPWRIIAANDKRHARVAVLEQVCEHLMTQL